MKKIIIASDSFKGSVSSLEVAESVKKAIHSVFPNCEVGMIPVADGGEGTVEAMVDGLNGQWITCKVHDPLMQPMEAAYGILGDGKTAVLEMASASGLTLVPPEKRNPMLTTTYGTGEMIRDALQRGCRQFLIGIGGSATNDAGTGMLQALGFRFCDGEGRELGFGGQILSHIRKIDCTHVLPALAESTFTVACDVNNPFSGKNGAAHIFARQKGADDAMIGELDNGLRHFAGVIEAQLGITVNNIPGAGAAGGLGGGFIAFLSAILKPGIQMVLEAVRFAEKIQGADLIITGEGKLDRQTGMGKTPAGVLNAATQQNIPVIAIGGSVEDVEALNRMGFLAILPIQPGVVSLQQAMDKAFACNQISRTVEQVLRVIKHLHSHKQ
ncbi:MAG: glycerate kinase [Tannerellaceae bacterium]|jgi:glycerate kinase|nr:glycerate kinase [Tannerellaceae bacterium]